MSQYINLFNPALQKRRDVLSAAVLASVTIAALLGVAITGVLLQQKTGEMQQQAKDGELRLKQERDKLVGVAKEAAERKPDTKLLEQLSRAEAVLKDHADLIKLVESGVIGKTNGFSAQMRAFANQSMSGLWLTGFSISAGDGEMEINGRTLNAELLPVYIQHLNSEDAFRGRSFAMLTLDRIQQNDTTLKVDTTLVGGSPAVQPPAANLTFSLSSKIKNSDVVGLP
ncbi:MAG: hypothetical protein V4568_18725 [Pseudomonadota bacterium]